MPVAQSRGARFRIHPLARLFIASIAALAMVYADPRSFACTLLVIVAWELAIVLPLKYAGTWILAQTIGATILLARELPLRFILPEVAIYLGFESYAVITAYVARSESESRATLARAHDELSAAQTLLAQTARASERLRIARELHDLLGHDLTALVMNLEVARHTGERAVSHIVKAQDLGRRLLADVRNVVKLMRVDDPVDLRFLLKRIAEDLPQIDFHFSISDAANAIAPECARVLIRVAQEAVTNSLRHSGCASISIAVSTNEDLLELVARDDGCGASSLEWGSGLRGMRERLESLGGELKINSDAKPGFVLIATMPWHAVRV